MKIGYFLSSEENGPGELLAQARAAEEAGFHGLWISDHFHPWVGEQGQSPFVWSVIGGLGEALNEQVLGDDWPEADVRLEMLEESIEIMRELWTGEVVSRQGRHYRL